MNGNEKRKVRPGDTVTRQPITIAADRNGRTPYRRGTVVYVHPSGRYHTVEFGEGGTAFRESFHGVEA